MTQSQRIVLNTVASYGRTVLSAVCGVFAARWVLQSLGKVDYGLYGLVGSLSLFMSYLNVQFSAAISRYYAVCFGKARCEGNTAGVLEECRNWFSVALMIHTVIPFLLLCIGWFVGGCCIVNGVLNIPTDRVNACVWVWRFVCIGTFSSMVNVPFSAMFTARQYIAEITIYQTLQTIAKLVFVYYMVEHPSDWLVGYGLGMMAIVAMTEMTVCVRALMVFPECRFRRRIFSEGWRFLALGRYAFWQAVGGLGFLGSRQGMSIIINNSFGPVITGSYTIAQTVASESVALTGALQNAFSPAVNTAFGARDMTAVRKLSFQLCKFGTILTLIFAVPAIIEIDLLLDLWLKTPPAFAAKMCICVLVYIVIEKISNGHVTAVNATGNIAKFQVLRGMMLLAVVPLALFSSYMGCGPVVTTASLVIAGIMQISCDIIMARTRVGMSARYWLAHVAMPIAVAAGCAFVFGIGIKCIVHPCFARLIFVGMVTSLVLASVSWLIVLDAEERSVVMRRLDSVLVRVGFRTKELSKNGVG